MKKTISIEGMSCMHCVNHVKEALEEIGATNIEVSLQDKKAVADFKEDITDGKIKENIEDFGYDVKSIL